MVDKLGELNYNIVINYNSDHSKAKAQEVADAVSEKYGVETFLVQANVADFDSCQHLVDEAVQHFGDKIDALVNNAVVTNNSNWVDVDHHAYEKLIGVNLMNDPPGLTVHGQPRRQGSPMQHRLHQFRGGLTGVINQADYCASKSGIIGLTRSLALEFAKQGVRVNAIGECKIFCVN